MKKTDKILVNGIAYKKPEAPRVIICMDGISQEYIERAMEKGVAPIFEKFKKERFYGIAESVIPSLTNPNNISIATGVSPREHGIVTSGLVFDRERGYEIISSQKHIKAEKILQAFSDAGEGVASITAKDKLKNLLLIRNGINISAEEEHEFDNLEAEEIIKKVRGRGRSRKLLDKTDEKWMYSTRPSESALDLGIELLFGTGPYIPKITYISLTDYIPHRHAPGAKEANNYINCIDKRIDALDKMGCVIGLTADHGMGAKHNSLGEPNAVWLKDILEQNKIKDYNILLPITDKYLGHHSCLGGCAWIYFKNNQDSINAHKIFEETRGIEEILFNNEAAIKYDLPGELIGDIFLLADKNSVLGRTRKEHSNIPKYLRSHGGIYEQKVPFILNKSLNREYWLKKEKGLRNFNIFEYALNGVEE